MGRLRTCMLATLFRLPFLLRNILWRTARLAPFKWVCRQPITVDLKSALCRPVSSTCFLSTWLGYYGIGNLRNDFRRLRPSCSMGNVCTGWADNLVLH